MPEPITLVAVGSGMVGLATHMARRYFAVAKEVADIALGFVSLVLTAPLLIACAAMIKISDGGPVFHVQTRVGKGGRLFRMYKLRTMHVDAESSTGAVWAAEGDSRVIGVCRWMRRSHVDELPQLINVICGEMSLVGPRPERPEIVSELEKIIPNYKRRLKVRPGITGLAQVRSGYDQTLEDVRRKLAADLEYIDNRRWRLELSILAGTLARINDKEAR